ncbi:hypothetical protein Q8F55_003538 [Vanrija albida]|uniref:Peptidase M20 dimerisation domain-containing protein n=1 Tax=Vanrija albida TaxID=181172 RepID=A0ABR3Q499_9TREE
MVAINGTTYRPRDLTINGQRLNDTLHQTCEFGAAHRWGAKATETGMARLALTDSDKAVRDWFVAEMTALGCDVKVDAMGNIFAVRAGENDGPPTAMGSHLDTQPTGGRYDGILGVMAAVEAMRTLHESGRKTKYPVAAIDWTNEEGARFPKSMHASSVWAGDITLADAHALADVTDDKVTTLSELQRIGYAGDVPCSWEANPLGAHFEIHIEQGPVLENAGQRVGIVRGGQAYKWFEIIIRGRDSHAGTTPMDCRADPLLTAAQFIVAASSIARAHGGLCTNGIFTAKPGSVNTIPNEVRFSLDIRHVEDGALAAIEAEIRARGEEITKTGYKVECSVEWKPLYANPAIRFHPACVAAVRAAALGNVAEEDTREIISGAGHDSCCTSKRVPTGMIFIPSKDGLSHNPEEYSTPEDCALGAQVLLDAVLIYDSQRTA